jgi:hypothetical protein
MTPVIRTIQIQTIPARRERNYRPNPAFTRRLWELISVRWTAVDGVAGLASKWHTAMTDFAAGRRGCGKRGCGGVAGEHAEAWAEGGYVCFIQHIRDVVYGDAAVASESLDLELRDALVGAVAGAEVEHGGPVVAEVFREGARGTCGGRWEVVGEGRVEGIAADDLVEVG